MKILITGSNGFIGKNLVSELKNRGYNELYECDIATTEQELNEYAKNCEFVFHLAGVNRPLNNEEYMSGNFGFTNKLLSLLKKYNNKSPILITSSIQAKLDNPYGISKKAGEDLIFKHAKEEDVKVYVYRLTNVFGKWCKPNYNSVIATFCYNISHNLDIKINDKNTELNLIYIDDVIATFINTMENKLDKNSKYYKVIPEYKIKLGKIVELLYSFKESRNNLLIPNMKDPFSKKLYSTYLSYLEENDFSYKLKMNTDNRGSFTELFKSIDCGQISVNIAKPGITKGNHWHHTKNEKFVVVSGKGLIQFRKIDDSKIIEYHVTGDDITVVDIPVGYTHNIINEGDTELITIMWCNELYDKEKPDTYFMEV